MGDGSGDIKLFILDLVRSKVKYLKQKQINFTLHSLVDGCVRLGRLGSAPKE
jgi:hypothetical protein